MPVFKGGYNISGDPNISENFGPGVQIFRYRTQDTHKDRCP